MIGGAEDHVHIPCRLSRQASVAHLVGQLKRHPSKWMKSVHPPYATFYWQNGYRAFLVSASRVDRVCNYIARQDEHYHIRTFKEKCRTLLDRHGIAFEEA